MDNILKITKYQLRDFRKSVLIYYSVILTLIGMILLILSMNNQPTGNSNFSGSSIIFVFVLSLNCFKNSFKFMQANNISRKKFYLGNIIALVSISAIIPLIDLALNTALGSLFFYEEMFEVIYTEAGILAKLLYNFTMLTFVSSLGWIVTMLYYRCNTFMKTIISIIPVILIIAFNYINTLTEDVLGKTIKGFIGSALGLTGNLNSYKAVLSFLIGAIGIFALIYLLIIRAPIKE